MRLDRRPELELDLRMAPERDRSRIPGPPVAVDECHHRTTARRLDLTQALVREGLAPELEKLAHRSCPNEGRVDLDDPGGIHRAQRVGTPASGDDRAGAPLWRRDADAGRNRDPAP